MVGIWSLGVDTQFSVRGGDRFSEELLLEIGRETLLVVLKLALPILGVTLIVGILVIFSKR